MAEEDPAFTQGIVENAKRLGLTARELRQRYEGLARVCGDTPEKIWGSHTRKLLRMHPDDAWIFTEAECKAKTLVR